MEIHGIPMPDNETNTDVEEKVLQVLKKIDTAFTKDAIDVVAYTDSEENLKLIKTKSVLVLLSDSQLEKTGTTYTAQEKTEIC